jgi:hydrogenase maturation protease
MMPRARSTPPVLIVGLGHPGGGDDAIGLFVARVLATMGFNARCTADPFLAVPILAEGRTVIVVDAVFGGGAPGEILDLLPSALAARPTCASTHGFGLREALALAQALSHANTPLSAYIVAIVLGKSPRHGDELSSTMQYAASRAIDHVANLARRLASSESSTDDPR